MKKIKKEEKLNNTLVFDLETTGLDTSSVELIGCASKHGDGEIKFDTKATKTSVGLMVQLADEVVGHNIKYDIQVVGNPPVDKIFDTMIAEWLLYPDQKKINLKYLGEKYFEEKNPGYKELLNQYKPKGMKVRDATLAVVPPEIVDKYAKKDVELTDKLYKIHKEKLKETGLEDLFYNLEMPFLKVVSDMEVKGIKFDGSLLKDMENRISVRTQELEVLIKKYAGEDFNVNSPKQLAIILYDKLMLPRLSENTTYSTNESILKRILEKHPIVPHVLEFRKLTKLLRTYVRALPTHVKKDGRIHPSFRQAGTGTGRISCSNPNLQNIPKAGETGGEIRKAFIPEKDHVFLIGDYDQMELRMLAHISNDSVMIESFRSGADFHRRTAQQILGKEEISDDERRMAKTINFGVIYGQTASGLAKALGTDYITARNFIYKYACTYSDAWTWRKMAMAASQSKPVIETIIGRRRDLNATTGMVDRMALNTPIQGSCADLVKIAMIRLSRELMKRNLKAKLILQVHDELVLETPKGEISEAKDLMQACMESVNILNDIVLRCPMRVQIEQRNTWFKDDK